MDDLAGAETTSRARYRSGFKLAPKGALYFEFTLNRVVVLRPQPARCWTSVTGEFARWSQLRDPPFEISERIRDVRAEDAGDAVDMRAFMVRRRVNTRKLLEHVPLVLQDQLLRGWHAGSWSLYRLLSSTPSAVDLCATDDGARVAYLLAHAHALVADAARSHALRKARRLVNRKRRDIMGALGFPATQASVQALGKLPPGELNEWTLTQLRQVLGDEHTRQRAAHLPMLSRAALAVLTPELSPLVSWPFLLQLAQPSTNDPFDLFSLPRLLDDTRRLSLELGQKLPVFGCSDEVLLQHGLLARLARKRLVVAAQHLPPVPYPLTDSEQRWARPLTSIAELVAEGDAMHHCLGTLQWQRSSAIAGNLVCFAVDTTSMGGTERLTLALERAHRHALWELHDLRGLANALPSGEMVQRAREMIARWNALAPVQLTMALGIPL